ncbi:hypothetical protein AcW1_001096 [Taiwanofungus camphoratus]|nr:hypothetical protein AcV5_005013 [Antrodia cinnamomea]KAI0964233.1 hypothetical protein AcW1_001096 [Antrodia cinnamomea]
MKRSMTSLNNLLNPESSREYSLRVQQSRSPSSSTSSPVENTNERQAIDETYYTQTDITIKPHIPHPNCPDTLTCLPDTDGRPQHTLPVILRCAILGSPKKRLTIREIYAAMEKKYPYYKTAGPAWKQSVRHHLSLNRLFERQPRPATDPGFGSYWTVNLDAPPGTKRPRKRGRANKDAPPDGGVTQATSSVNYAYMTPIPGMTPKSQEKMPERSHPPTLRPVDSRSFSQMSSLRSRGAYDDEEDEDGEWEEEAEAEGTHISDDDYESEDDLHYRYPRVPSSSSSTVACPPNRSVLYGAFSSYGIIETKDAVIERLKMEMAGLRRQSTDAVARLSNDLVEARADAQGIRVALRILESRLEEETRRRREAEHIAEEEARLRLAAEEALRAYQLQRRPPGYSSSRS